MGFITLLAIGGIRTSNTPGTEIVQISETREKDRIKMSETQPHQLLNVQLCGHAQRQLENCALAEGAVLVARGDIRINKKNRYQPMTVNKQSICVTRAEQKEVKISQQRKMTKGMTM